MQQRRIVGNRRDELSTKATASPDIAHLSAQRRSDNEGWNTSPSADLFASKQLLVQVRSTGLNEEWWNHHHCLTCVESAARRSTTGERGGGAGRRHRREQLAVPISVNFCPN